MSLQVRMQADDFLTAYHVLEKSFNTECLTIMGPSIVCLAFAVELYLKDLHFALTGKTLRGHNICGLFKELPQEIRREIFTCEAISQNPFLSRGNIHSPRYYSREYSFYERFIDQMKAISDGFNKWRYSYESTTLSYDTSFALALIKAIISTSDNIRRKP